MDQLDSAVLARIFSKLSHRDLARASTVCKSVRYKIRKRCETIHRGKVWCLNFIPPPPPRIFFNHRDKVVILNVSKCPR